MHKARKRKFKGKRHYPKEASFHSKGIGNLGIKSDWSLNKPGHKLAGQKIPFGRLPGSNIPGLTFISQHEMYLADFGECFIELHSNYQSELVIEFMWTGYAQVPKAFGIIKLLRMLMADVKGPWTKAPFWFNGRKVKPGSTGWKIEKFDRLKKGEITLTRPVIKAEPTPYDDKLGFEDKAQMNAEFEKRFSS